MSEDSSPKKGKPAVRWGRKAAGQASNPDSWAADDGRRPPGHRGLRRQEETAVSWQCEMLAYAVGVLAHKREAHVSIWRWSP